MYSPYYSPAMIRTSSFVILLLTCLLCTSPSYAEKKIKKEEVPAKITAYIDKEYKGAKHINYYEDNRNDTLYYEVELTYQKEKLSLTFFSDGNLYELEKKVKFKSLPSDTQQNILSYLNKTYSRYKISEVQFVNPHLKTEYELSIKAKDKTGLKFYEMYFSKNGSFLYSDEIKVKPIQTLF